MPMRAPSGHPGRVIVVGSTNTDLVVHCPALPKAGETVLGDKLLTFAGGKGANQAVAAARAGARVYFIGAFGDDAFGAARRKDLEVEGVDCSGCVVKKGVPSGVALIAIQAGKGSKRAENLIVVAPGANALLSPADVRRGMPKELQFNDVLLCSLEVPLAAVAQALRSARAKGAGAIVNPAPMPAGGLPTELTCATLTPNETEFECLFRVPAASARAGERLYRSVARFEGRDHVIVTRGRRGALVYYWAGPPGAGLKGLSILECPAPRVEPVDTVGAGDCFNGCLAACLAVEPLNCFRAARFAVAAAALKVTRHGAQAGMPRRHEIMKILKRVPRWRAPAPANPKSKI